MENTSKQNNVETRTFSGWWLVAYVVAISIAVDAALVLSVAGHLSWLYSIVAAFSAAVLTAGALFTLLQFKVKATRTLR